VQLPELGPRGEGWVAIQLVLIGAIAACTFAPVSWPHELEGLVRALGVVAIVAGALVFVLGARTLGSAITPFPRPASEARLHEGGLFRYVRHPVYDGVILLALGWSLAEAPLGLLPTALLAVFFDLKARREEAWLDERYPGYSGYLERTPWRFVPWLY
jgi:protein-S-isoprenylcysteine O-methyltransferase Ste14